MAQKTTTNGMDFIVLDLLTLKNNVHNNKITTIPFICFVLYFG
jgi:hypothetical protein